MMGTMRISTNTNKSIDTNNEIKTAKLNESPDNNLIKRPSKLEFKKLVTEKIATLN
jgi:hypothetical protein